MPDKHTPGSWLYDTTRSYYGRSCVRMNGIVVCEINQRLFPSHGDMDANGHLIAAAPELLEACKAALAQLRLGRASQNPDVNQAAIILDAAIANAEGR